MVDFDYQEWDSNTPLSSDRFTRMSDNDQHLKDLASAGPQGVLAYNKHTGSRVMRGTDSSLRTWFGTSTNLDTTFTVGENRLIRATYYCVGIYGGAVGVREAHTRLRLDDERNFGYSKSLCWARYRNAFSPLSRIGTLTAGEHELKAELMIWTASSGGLNGVTWEGYPNAPMYILVEDLGQAP